LGQWEPLTAVLTAVDHAKISSRPLADPWLTESAV